MDTSGNHLEVSLLDNDDDTVDDLLSYNNKQLIGHMNMSLNGSFDDYYYYYYYGNYSHMTPEEELYLTDTVYRLVQCT